MTQVSEYTIRLIRSLMGGQPVPPIPDGVSLEALYAFARSHCVEALVFRGLPERREDPLWRQWENRAEQLLAQSIVQLQERDDLIRALTGDGIDVLPVKGCWLKERYPELSDRQMADLDMLIHPEDASRAERLLLKRGYTKGEVCFQHTAYLQRPYLEVELHTSLLPDINRHRDYYDGIWGRAERWEENPRLYRLKPEDEYIFYMVHLQKHLLEGGSGIRSVLDQLIYARSFPDLDPVYLERELEALGLTTLWKQVQALCGCWFETGQPVPEALRPLEEAVCRAGAYGHLEERTRSRMEQLKGRYPNPVIRLFAYCLPRFFRPLSEMRRCYPVLEKAPVLLPVFWVVRIVSMMLHNEKHFWQHLGTLLGKGAEHG